MNYRDDYLKKLEEIQNYLDFAIDISEATAGQKNVQLSLANGHQLYNRLTMTCLSFIHLLPRNRYFPSKGEFWDFFSLATLGRSFAENYFAFFYVCVEHVTLQESEFRQLLLTFHMNNEKYKFFKESNADADLLKEFEAKLPEAKRELAEHPFIQTLNKKAQGDLLKGNLFKYLSNKEIAERIPFSTKEFNPLYRFLSNHTHSTPWSFFTQNNSRGRGIENETEVVYVSLTIDFVTKYLLAAIIDMMRLFPEKTRNLEKWKVKHVKEQFQKKIKVL